MTGQQPGRRQKTYLVRRCSRGCEDGRRLRPQKPSACGATPQSWLAIIFSFELTSDSSRRVRYLCFSGMGRLNSFTPPTPPKMCTLPLLVVMRRWSTQAPARTCARAVNISRFRQRHVPGPVCTVGAVDIPKRPYTATMCSSRASLTVFWEGLAIEHHTTHTQRNRADEKTMRRLARLDVPSSRTRGDLRAAPGL